MLFAQKLLIGIFVKNVLVYSFDKLTFEAIYIKGKPVVNARCHELQKILTSFTEYEELMG